MEQSVLMSIHPKYCVLIAAGEKKIEVRKSRPRINSPFKVYIYCTKDGDKNGYQIFVKPQNANQFKGICTGTVIGEFVCEKITKHYFSVYEGGFEQYSIRDNAALSYTDLYEYLGDDFIIANKPYYAWHISNLVIYDKPKELSEFVREGDCEGGIKCKTCPYSEKGNEAAGLEDDCIAPFDTTKRIPITRPPQSWCYVEVSNEV